MITIIDLDMGNPRSILNMLYRLGFESEITRDQKKIAQSEKIILPGVGSFDTAIENLEKYDLIKLLTEESFG